MEYRPFFMEIQTRPSLVARSANDAAVALGERVSGSEGAFDLGQGSPDGVVGPPDQVIGHRCNAADDLVEGRAQGAEFGDEAHMLGLADMDESR